MRRLAIVGLVVVAAACSGSLDAFPFGDRSSGARLSFASDSTETSGALLAYDPARHSMNISITLPLEQSDDIDVFIVTSTGVRFQILESFQDCTQNVAGRHCTRWLPVLPDEEIDNWRVEAVRQATGNASQVDVDVTWVPLGS